MIPSDHPAKIRALIVDDEPLARSNIAVLLRMNPEIGMIGECGSGTEAIGEIRIAKPDLLFLDVQMPECDGFDVLELIGKDLPPAVVFVTAYDQYALRAFELNVGPQKPLGPPLLKRVLVMAEQALHPAVNLRAAEPANRTLSEAARNASISTKLNFSAPSTLIIHPQLARSDSFRLILRWNQLPAPGSSCVGQE